VPALEADFIRAIVDRFEHHGHLVWVVAEEYSEALSARRASGFAAEIRTADDFNHPIAVHKLNGNSFDEFANDPNVDQFSQQQTASTADGFHRNVLTAYDNADGRFNVNMSEGHLGSGMPHGVGRNGRLNNWAVAMAGAYVMQLGWDISSNTDDDLTQCGYLVRFMESTRFDTMQPDDGRALADTDYVMANSNDTFILYAASRSADMGVRNVDAGEYDLIWIDAETGLTIDETGVAIAGGDTTFSVPGALGSEVAVHIRRAEP
jgi:hypothetical protein